MLRAIILAVVIGAILLLLFIAYGRKPAKIGIAKKPLARIAKNTVIFVGCRNSGKTSLIYRLVFNEFPATTTTTEVTSIRAAELPESFLPKCDIYDCPGHRKLQASWTSVVDSAAVVVLVVDSASKICIKACAELLLDLLLRLADRQAPLVVCCSKTDLPGARRLETVKTELAREISRLRNARAADDPSEFVGVRGRAFTFEFAPMPISFVECSAHSDRVDELVDALKSCFST